MGKVHEEIDAKLKEFIGRQHLYFVGTAPNAPEGRLNISPKGLDTFRILSPKSVAYLDLTGSGVETIAHLRENGRIVVMFCAFEGPPKIVRLHGRGRAVLADDPEFRALRRGFAKTRDLGLRSIIVVDVERIADSCGFAVPLMDHVADRDVLDVAQGRRDESYFSEYGATRNAVSVDGLPGLSGLPSS